MKVIDRMTFIKSLPECDTKDDLFYKQTRYYVKVEEQMQFLGFVWSDFQPTESESVYFGRGRGYCYTKQMTKFVTDFYKKECDASIISIFRGHQHYEGNERGLLWPLIKNNGLVAIWDKTDFEMDEYVGRDFTGGINLLNTNYVVYTILSASASCLLFNKDIFITIDFKNNQEWILTHVIKGRSVTLSESN